MLSSSNKISYQMNKTWLILSNKNEKKKMSFTVVFSFDNLLKWTGKTACVCIYAKFEIQFREKIKKIEMHLGRMDVYRIYQWQVINPCDVEKNVKTNRFFVFYCRKCQIINYNLKCNKQISKNECHLIWTIFRLDVKWCSRNKKKRKKTCIQNVLHNKNALQGILEINVIIDVWWFCAISATEK